MSDKNSVSHESKMKGKSGRFMPTWSPSRARALLLLVAAGVSVYALLAASTELQRAKRLDNIEQETMHTAVLLARLERARRGLQRALDAAEPALPPLPLMHEPVLMQ